MFGLLDGHEAPWHRAGEVGSGDLVAYSDSDWASDPVTRRSVGGHVIFFGKSILSWSSKTQKGILALSMTEAEFIHMARGVHMSHLVFTTDIQGARST